MDPFWKQPLCDFCRQKSKYSLITALMAKKMYILNEDDLLSLRTMSKENTHHKRAGHIRYFSCVAVQDKSISKLFASGRWRKERLVEQWVRSKHAKEGREKMMEERRSVIRRALRDGGFSPSHDCPNIQGYVRNGWHRWWDRVRWSAEEVINQCRSHLDLDENSWVDA